ncbi:tetratricopeptide repeat-containing sensor histidine kinase [Portibacter lacus]|uniref:histidine kinase n=1 Tax=Portibacter lacus TaxID=1099794 RepID=A0AA37STB7_9BACT|nr:histidine kinase dimerization/phosphoacceptor domain -containing protein [Portibacter lacus]GLR19279.1 hypothetical protein GCM10007940_38950 [Portibacter lacus]
MKLIYTLLLICVIPCTSFSNIDSLKRVIDTRQDTSAVLAGYELGKAMVSINLDTSYLVLVQAALLADQLDYTNGKLVTYRSIGGIAPRIGKYEEGLFWLDKGLILIDSLQLPLENKVDFLTNIGVAHYTMGFIGKAIEPYIEAVNICRENGLDKRRSRLLNNLGIFYRNLGRYDESIKIYEQSYELRKASGDVLGMGNLAFNMATAYYKMSELDKALEKLDEAESIYREANSETDLIHTIIAKGNAYAELDNMEEAGKYYLRASEFPYEQLESPFNINLYNGLALVAFSRGDLNQVEKYLNKISEDVFLSDLAEQKILFYELSAKMNKEKGDFEAAFDNLSELKELQDHIAEEDKTMYRQEMETKYLTVEKESEIALLNTQNELTEIKLKNARYRNIGLGIGLLAFSGLLLWLFKLYQKTKQQKEEISLANKDKDVLLKEIHHRVKNNLQVVSSLLTLQSKYIVDESALAAIHTGKTRVESMSILHKSLYQKENLKNISVKNYFEDLIENLITTYHINDKNIKILMDIEDLELDVDTVMPLGLITNELISNALKYAFENKQDGEIAVTLKKLDEKLYLKVSDNGLGIPFTVIPVKSKTLGMELIKSFTKKLGAKISIRNEHGTMIEIEIPQHELVL